MTPAYFNALRRRYLERPFLHFFGGRLYENVQ
jgi:hypothetical protein